MQLLPTDVDVLIVGCGPVGATIGNLLGNYGVRTLIVDQATDVLMHPRAIALDHEALRILQQAGLAEGAFSTVSVPHVRMHSPYFGEFGRMNTCGVIDGHAKLVTFYQPELERALRQGLSRHPSAQVALGVRMDGLVEGDQAVHVTLRQPDGTSAILRAKFVVGADGANSIVRESIGLALQGKTYGQDWLIVDARRVARPIDHVEFLCNPDRPTPHMVAPDGRQRWEFMLRPGETREAMEHPDKVRELLAPWVAADEVEIERKAVYRFHARLAESFRRGRVLLAGDAAHITPPFAGQGLVAGLRDAANLAWKLAWVLQGRAAPTILESYNTERRPHAKEMIRTATLLGHLIMPRNRLLALVSHGLVKLLRRVPAGRWAFDDMGLKPKNRFARGLFVRGRRGAGLRRGAMVPQGIVRASGGTSMLSDDALGPHLTLVGFGVDPAFGLDAELRERLAAAGGRAVQFTHRGQQQHLVDAASRFEDLTGALFPGAAPFGWVALVRPDGVVLHDGPCAEVAKIVSQGLELLGSIASPRARASVASQGITSELRA